MAAEFIQLIADANVPEEVVTSLEGFDVALFARSCESPDELESFNQHAIASAGVTQLPQRMLAKASIRLLFSRCRAAESLPHLGAQTSGGNPAPAAPATSQAPPSASSSWQEAWPAKLSSEKTAELRRRVEDDYPTELLDAEVFPSSRLLALTSKMVAGKEIRWLPWRFRLSAKAQDDNLMIRLKKLPRLQELSDLLLEAFSLAASFAACFDMAGCAKAGCLGHSLGGAAVWGSLAWEAAASWAPLGWGLWASRKLGLPLERSPEPGSRLLPQTHHPRPLSKILRRTTEFPT